MKPLEGKIALVTGAAKHLGRAIAIHLAQQGAAVGIHYHQSQADAQETLAAVQRHSTGCIVSADIVQEKAVADMFTRVEKELGTVDVVVNLVGNFIYEPITTTSYEKFRDVIDTNLSATFLCCHRALPAMQKKQWGRIINFGCVAADGITIRQNTTPYYIAKTGVIMLTKVLAYEYAKDGITINSISPGILETSVAKPPTPTGRCAQFTDIIHALDFFLDEKSHYVNGANLEVAGGWRPGY